MSRKLTLTVEFTIGEETNDDSFKLGGTVNPAGAPEVIECWLRSQMGEGPDAAEPRRQNVYHIEIDWYPISDKFLCRSDCGNAGLRDGLLLYVLKRLIDQR